MSPPNRQQEMELFVNEMPKDEPSEAQEFQFLTFTNLSQTAHPETRRRVRSHAMHRVQRSLRARRQERNETIVLNISPLMEASSSSQQSLQGQELGTSLVSLRSTPHPSDLGSGRSDPFKQYPIDMDLRTHELFDHLHGDTCPMFKTMKKIGFFNIVEDEAGFRQILCTSSSHMTQLRNRSDNPEAIRLSIQAIQSLNRMIPNPELGYSNATIVAILAFACHAVMFNDLTSLLTHLNGLFQILQQKGGVETLNTSPVLRIMLFWVDVNAAFLQDLVPRLTPPYDILPPPFTSQQATNILDDSLRLSLAVELVPIFEQIILLNRFIQEELETRQLWDDGVFCGLHIMPILSQLLSIRFNIDGPDPDLVRYELIRICATIYLAKLRQKFGVDLSLDIYIPKLKYIIVDMDVLRLRGANPILLWGLLISGLQSLGHPYHSSFISMAATSVVNAECNSWDELVDKIGRTLWIQQAFDLECGVFREELSAELWASFGVVFSA
ncbi:hypothetical protein F5884DRAFT_511447 [Xylogone sp. PMI_703]|nr:hypothetical protein F5884DRAFT_511447 [Xylogone sp. PMI_703]